MLALADRNIFSTEDSNLGSLGYLNSGSAENFVRVLKEEIGSHPAVNHPLLTRLAAGEFRDPLAVLRDYAHQYSYYSEWFTHYLDGVIENLESEAHQEALRENMKEELGIPGSSRKEDLPHVELFRLFQKSVGADPEYCSVNAPCTTVLLWRDLFLQKCRSNIKGVGLAAIGLATEGIISSVYPHILKCVTDHTNLGADARLFFELHIDCDDDHANVLDAITTELAEDISAREAIRFGAFSSLNLRKAFWDTQLARAIAI